jgi:uncharacterized protein DUF87
VSRPRLRFYRFQSMNNPTRTEETRQFLGRLRRALRAAHGLGLSLTLRWLSGPEGGVVIGVPPIVGDRWVTFGLSSTYELGQWRAFDMDAPPSVARSEYVLSASSRVELPFPTPLDQAPWSEAVLGYLRGLRPGVVVEWGLVPDPSVPGNGPRPHPSGQQRTEEFRYRTHPEQGLKDEEEARRTALRWAVAGRIALTPTAAAREDGSRVAHLLEVSSHLDGGNGFVCWPVRSILSKFRPVPILSEAELVGLFPPPNSTVLLPAASARRPSAQLWLGRDLMGSCVGLPLRLGEGRHLLILGETGMGKSSMLTRLAWQAARWGSVILFDPVGDTAGAFLAGLPSADAERVAWVSPSRSNLSLNLLAEVASKRGESVQHRERVLEDVVAALRRVRAGRYSESAFWGPRLEEMLFQALRAASRWPGASLAVAERLLAPDGSIERSAPDCAREAVRDIRRRIEQNPQDGEGARRLLSEITRSTTLSEMLDDPAPTWSVDSGVAPGRVTVVSGDAAQVGESAARYLLAIVLALTWNAALARASPSKTFVILDEAQWYSHESVVEMLRLGRRYNLHVWAVTQSLHSLPEAVRDAFLTNSADVVLFRGDPLDARDISRWVPCLASDRIMRMPRGEAVVLIDKGAEIHWVPLSPPPVEHGDPSRFLPPPRESAPSLAGPELGSAVEERVETGALSGLGLAPPEARIVLEAVRDWAHRGDRRAELKVHLAQLRLREDIAPAILDREVRFAGRYLAAAGILVRKGKDDEGNYWILSRERLLNLPLPERTATGAGA